MVAGTPLPEGEVTFVFTDVQGSTRLLERFPADYGRLIQRHHELLEGAVEQFGGIVFETIGDAVYAAFADPAAAAHAAVELQRRLSAEDWRPMDPIRVRAGVHTGVVERRDRHYFGPALYRCARLMATAHGGQVVLSEATTELVRARLVEGESVVDLGRHRLKDLQDPERIFQLAAPGLPTEFPPLRSVGGRPNNLPAEVKAFLGRRAEVARLVELLTAADARVVTLTGPGGSGKTRLALRAAGDLLEPFRDGVFFVDLAPLGDDALVAGQIAEVLRVPLTPGRALVDSIVTHLAALEVLLVLDNFEHVAAAATDVAAIVAGAPRVRVLVTSRIALGIQGEHELLVPPLALPSDDADADEVLQSPAVQLFLARAREAGDAGAAGEDLTAIADICRRLDGLPLAIELAAARTRVLPPGLLLQRLDARLDLLTHGPVDVPPRQRTLRATIAWSYELLDEPQRAALRRLGVFRGGCTIAAAEAVVGEGAFAVLDSLVRQSLLGVRWDESGAARFELLETVAEFARERLVEAAEDELAAARHAAHFADYAERVGPHLYDDDRGPWLRRLGDDRDNLRGALAWSLAHGEPLVGMRIMSAIWLWWWTGFREARVWAEQLLASAANRAPTPELAGTAFVAEIAAAGEGDIPAARRHAELAVQIASRIGDDRWLALSQALGSGALAGFVRPGEAEGPASAAAATMRTLCEDAIAAGQRSGDRWAEAWATMISALIALLGGEAQLARAWAADGVAKLRGLDDSWSAATGSTTLALSLIQLGDLAAAEEALRGTVDALLAVGDLRIAINARIAHGLIARFSGDTAAAERHYRAALELCARSGDPANAPLCLEGIAAATAASDPERSARLLGAAHALYEAGSVPGVPGFEPMYEATLEAVTSTLGDSAADRLIAAGAVEARQRPLLDLDGGPGPLARAGAPQI